MTIREACQICAVCDKKFKDETDLNTHTLFEHGIQRGYCQNPKSETHIDELTNLHKLRDDNYKIILKYLDSSPNSVQGSYARRVAFETRAVLNRLEELGEENKIPLEIRLREFIPPNYHFEKKPVFRLWQHLKRTTEEWYEIDKQAELDVKQYGLNN